jgi:KaiC/GvpD/RAD55 family RecA-like ATPase
LGLRLGNAVHIDEGDFVGHETELEQLRRWLAPRPNRQNVVALCGLGGIGKTQLSIHFARRFIDTYSSIFWLNAQDESILKAGLVELAAQVLEESSVNNSYEEERMVQQVRQWFSRPDNDRWLVVFDNYDNPHVPGITSTTSYAIRNYFPHRVQGSILITTRSPKLGFAKQLAVKKLDDINQSLSILAARSGREIIGGEKSY